MTFLKQVQFNLYEGALIMVCLSNGLVVFVRNPHCPVYYDINGEVCSMLLPGETFALWKNGEEPIEFEYNRQYNYREHPLMLAWLKTFNLINPFQEV